AGAVRDMRERVWKEKGGGLWDLKQARGGLVELEFLTQFLQLVHAAETPAILDTNTEAALRKLNDAGLLAGHGEALVDASRFFHALTQVLRLCFDGPFMPERAPEGLKHFLAGVADEPNFSHLEARLADVQSDVSAAFTDLLG
ncbi:MAG: bifunctional [glutamine synthetase] adenylyltransferase/[glutamine synthetase]-adenylyl-L-tyrosine phosphorylase, partial [Pseudomonadota bacterium]